MRSFLRPILILSLALGVLTGCATSSKEPAIGPSPEYQAALAKIVRVPQPHPLLDEGVVPLPALEIVVAYQDIARRGKYRELARYYDAASQAAHKDSIESRLLRREIETGAAIDVLRDVTKTRDTHGIRYEFRFESVQRATTRSRSIDLLETADHAIVLVSDGP